MEGISNLLKKLSVKDVEKLKVLMSLTPEASEKEIVTLRVFAEEYKILIKNNRSSSYLRSITIALNHLLKYFGPQTAINNISLKDIESFIIFLQKQVKKGYRVYYRNLKAAFNKAKDWGYVNENYFTKIKLPKKQKLKPIFINSDELSEIIKKIDVNIVKDVVTFGFYTGMRLSEIVNLKWKNINLSAGTIMVGDEEFITKTRNQRFIPICDEVLEILISKIKSLNTTGKDSKGLTKSKALILPVGSSYVFCKINGERFTGDYFSKGFKQACKAAGMDKELHFHSLRHSFASNLAQQGVSLYVIKELLGHSSISTTEIYSHLNMETLRDAISVLDDCRLDNKKTDSNKRNSKLRIIVNQKIKG